jgi:hypothetical protein
MAIDRESILEKLATILVGIAQAHVSGLGGVRSDTEIILRRAADIAQTVAVTDCSNCPYREGCVTRTQIEEENKSNDLDLKNL